ncbi:MAG: DNA topoisomerase IB [Silvibacterium sp.]
MHKPEIVIDPVESAKYAGLCYVSDAKPGITRKRAGRGFRYLEPDGSLLRDHDTLARIKSLVIPPAWKDVWICSNPKGHLQVTGRDAKGRKQSRYHPRWREVRDETKYERMLVFGTVLPKIREQVEQDLHLPGLPRTKVLATVVRLMELTLIRVGNTEYARDNGSYGLTTMKGRHVRVEGATITFKFQGKSKVRHTIDVRDRQLARIVQRCQDIPGFELFQYADDAGDPHTIDSADVNEYLRELSKEDFTAKDFRTWAGTVLTCLMLRDREAFESATEAKRNVVEVIKGVAKRLGNTPTVCRKCYVHPAVLDCYFAGALIPVASKRTENLNADSSEQIQTEETGLLHLLRQQMEKNSA